MLPCNRLSHMVTLSLLAIGLVGCASTYQPVIDPKGVDMGQYNRDLYECRQLAEQVNATEDTATSALVGGGIGAAAGAALGAIGGHPGTGAATGAVIGGFGGGGAQALGSTQKQKTIIRNCLGGRGYRVLD